MLSDNVRLKIWKDIDDYCSHRDFAGLLAYLEHIKIIRLPFVKEMDDDTEKIEM